MKAFELNSYLKSFNEGFYIVSQPLVIDGLVPGGHATVNREENGDLTVTITSNGTKSWNDKSVAGAIYSATDTITFKSPVLGAASAYGAVKTKHNSNVGIRIPDGITTETFLISRIEISIQNDGDEIYLLECVQNSGGHEIWPHNGYVDETILQQMTLSGVGDSIEAMSSSQSHKSNGFVHFIIDGFSIFYHPSFRGENSGYGHIIYRGIPSETFRQKIRDCLSFCLGRYLVYAGSISFSENWDPLKINICDMYSLDGRAYELHALPPAPIWTQYYPIIDINLFVHCVQSIYENYDKIDFLHLSWRYWHARCAPSHIAAVHFGSAIEYIQRQLIFQDNISLQTTILSPKDWSQFRKNTMDVIDGLNLSHQISSQLKQKLSSLNQVHQGELLQQLFSKLNLSLGLLEKESWKQRNSAAHGFRSSSEKHSKLIQTNNVLQGILHRLILRACKASDLYYDYYSLNHPIRLLENSID